MDYCEKEDVDGILRYKNGKLKYTGNLINGVMNRDGCKYDENGKLEYAGNWEDGKLDGIGLKITDGIFEYIGFWKRGQLQEKIDLTFKTIIDNKTNQSYNSLQSQISEDILECFETLTNHSVIE